LGSKYFNTVWEWAIGAIFRRRIEQEVAERRQELIAQSDRIVAALRGANVHIFFQDADLRYTSVIGSDADGIGAQLLGRTDEQVLPSTERDAAIAIKRKVLATGEPEDCDVAYVMPEGRAVFALHIEPVFGTDGTVEGISCAAVDLARVRTLESEQGRLSGEFKTAVQRYELALRESNVTVFTQDRDLRYTSISNPVAGLAIEDIVGRTDEDILTEEGRAAATVLKRQALDTGSAQDGEIAIGFLGEPARWFDVHVDPLRDVTGEVTGLVGTAVDITRRREDEAHLRLLLHELTHRSKNLLAVIQAMARQTARHAGSLTQFLTQFDARLQALAVSHDLLIEEGWHGASLGGLVQLQLQPLLEYHEAQVSIAGPTVLLKPEAAQALGMALHELASNASKFGALSVPHGRLAIAWRRMARPDGDAVEFSWTESAGPAVQEPTVRRFGRMMIERNLAHAVGGGVKLAFPADGVRCDITIPPMYLVGFAAGGRAQT
jgi:PAS domain S-box-containing protein